MTSVTSPDSVTSIGDYSFSGCSGLKSVTIPKSVKAIGAVAIENSADITIRGVPGSEAERYANENGIPFEAIP